MLCIWVCALLCLHQLLDVGTEPQPYAFAKLYMAMENNPQLGGVCGEITVRNPKIYNLIEASQYFEYKISHVMDKAMESVFGYISVLPGAFSAYRWVAIRGEPLNQYFYVEEHSVKEMGPFMANMYLAEDRVLCFELLSKRNRNWTMHYVTGSIAKTDVPTTLLELTKQRRRWLNGSFFSLVFYVTKFNTVLHRSDHGLWRRLALSVQFVYMLGLLCLNWLSVGSLFLSLVIIFSMAFDQIQTASTEIMYMFTLTYTFITILQLIAGLGSKVQDVQKLYFVSAMGYGVVMLFALALSAWHLLVGRFSTTILVASAGAFASYALSALIHGELPATASAFVQYMFMLPTYVNMFTIFSFCNMHDISWGTKEGNLQHEKARMTGHGKDNRMKQLVDNLKDTDNKAMAGVTAADLEKVEALRRAGDTGNAELDEIRRTALAFSEAAQRAMEERVKEEVEARTKALKKQEAEMAQEFESFRTRLLSLWLLSNWTYVTAVMHFNLVEFYAFLIAGLIAFTLIFRLVGSIWYQSERIFKSCWVVFCGWCCCTPFWMPPPADEMDGDWAKSRGDIDGYSADSDEDRWMRGSEDYSGTETETETDTEDDDSDFDAPPRATSRASRRGGSNSRAPSRGSRISRARSHARSRASRRRSTESSGTESDTGSDSGSDSRSDSSGYSRRDLRNTPRATSRPGRTRGAVSSAHSTRSAAKVSSARPASGAGVDREHNMDLSNAINEAQRTSSRVVSRGDGGPRRHASGHRPSVPGSLGSSSHLSISGDEGMSADEVDDIITAKRGKRGGRR